MKKIEYFEILKKAFLLTWKNRSMWFFGFLILLGSFSYQLGNNENNNSGIEKKLIFEKIQSFFEQHPYLFGSVLLGIILLTAIFFLLSLIGRAAVIKMTNNIAVYKQSPIKSIFSEAKKYLWKFLLIDLFVGIFVMLVTLALLAPTIYLFSIGSKVLAVVFMLLAAILIFSLLIISFYLIKYANIYIALSDMKIKDSLESAYDLLEKHYKESIIFGLMIIGLNIALIFLTIIIIFTIALIFLPIGILLYFLLPQTGLFATTVLIFIAIFIILIVFMSFFQAFLQSAWVLFFQQIALDTKEEKKKEKVVEPEAILPDPEAA